LASRLRKRFIGCFFVDLGMRVYLSVPIIANSSADRARWMAEVISAAGHQLISPWVLSDREIRPSESIDIFTRDRTAVEGCDAIVADVSKPSTGVGMEVMAAYISKKRIVLVAEAGSTVTRMLTDMKGAEWVRFTDEASLRRGLEEKLSKR
jgi:nucleoside 2-deoxyribosyltransferase